MKPRLSTGRLPSQLGVDAPAAPPSGVPRATVASVRATGVVGVPDRAVAVMSDTPRAIGVIAFVRPIAQVAVPDRPSADVEELP